MTPRIHVFAAPADKFVVNRFIFKAVPPFAKSRHSPSMDIKGHAPGVFVCGDDPEARAMVAERVRGAEADAAGPLKLACVTEPLGMLVTNLAYVQAMESNNSANLIR